jgi:hypothetical protein
LTDSNKAKKPDNIKILNNDAKSELFARLAKIALASLPGGGSIAELIDYGMTQMKEKRLREFLRQLRVDIEETRIVIDKNYVKTEDFAYLFEQTFRAVSVNYQKEKLEAYKALLLNSLIEIDEDSETKEYFLYLLNSITVTHLVCLKVIYDPTSWMSNRKMQIGPLVRKSRPLDDLRFLLPMYDSMQIIAIINDLSTHSLVSLPKGTESLYEEDEVRLGVLSNMLTELGRSFLRFITKHPV